MIRCSILYILFLILASGIAQPYKKHDPVIKDFNKDNVLDTLYSFYESGSTFGGTDLKIVNGKNAEVYELSNYGCYCEMKRVHFIPPLLNKPENQPFLSVIQEKLFPIMRKTPDPSLQWIIEGYSSNKKLSQHKYFDLILYPEINWSIEKIEIPEDNYSLVLTKDTLGILLNDKDSIAKYDKIKAFVSYCGHCHKINKSVSEFVAENNDYKVYKTDHGVFVQKGELQKWVLVNDLNLTGGPGKLRWESILQVVLIDKYLVILFSGAPDIFDTIFISNIETGAVGRLKHPFRRFLAEPHTRMIKDTMIRYNNEEEESFYVNYNEVFTELDDLYESLTK